MNPRAFILGSRIIGACFLLPTLVAAGIGFYFYESTVHFRARAVVCEGRVAEMVGRGDGTFSPVFTYVDSTGVTQRGRSPIWTNPPAYSVGDSIALLYDPKNPRDVRINSFWHLWLGALIGGVLAAPFFVMAICFLLVAPLVIRRVWVRDNRDIPKEPG